MTEINWAPWLHDGMLSTTPGKPNLNMLGYTAQACFFGFPLEEGIARCCVARGVYSRSQTTLINTKIDDYLSLGCSPTLAGHILSALSDGLGFLDVTGPHHATWDRKQWFYLFPGFIAHLKYSCGQPVGPFLRFSWAVSMWLAARKPVSNQDGWLQSDLMARVYMKSGKRSWLCDQALAYWTRKMPKPIWQIVQDYIGFPDHPLVILWREASEHKHPPARTQPCNS